MPKLQSNSLLHAAPVEEFHGNLNMLQYEIRGIQKAPCAYIETLSYDIVMGISPYHINNTYNFQFVYFPIMCETPKGVVACNINPWAEEMAQQ